MERTHGGRDSVEPRDGAWQVSEAIVLKYLSNQRRWDTDSPDAVHRFIIEWEE
jgi:hypothetical protein